MMTRQSDGTLNQPKVGRTHKEKNIHKDIPKMIESLLSYLQSNPHKSDIQNPIENNGILVKKSVQVIRSLLPLFLT